MTAFTESVVEDAALAWLEAIGWPVAHGPDIAPDMPAAERHLRRSGAERTGGAVRERPAAGGARAWSRISGGHASNLHSADS